MSQPSAPPSQDSATHTQCEASGDTFHLMRRIVRLLPVLLAMATTPTAAQRILPPGYQASWWSTADGLPGNFVSDITQGSDGRLWLLAGGILTRFDGRTFEPIAVDAAGGRGDEPVVGVETGGGDTIWVATSANRVLARTRGAWQTAYRLTGQLTEMVAHPGHPPAGRVAEALTHTLWRAGRYLPMVGAGRFDAANRPSITIDRSGTLWVMDSLTRTARAAGADGGAVLPLNTGRFVVATDDLTPLGVRRLGGRLEVVDTLGEVRFSVPDAPGRDPRLITRDGRLVVITPTHLEIFTEGDARPDAVPFRATGLTVLSITEDREGGLWLGTGTQGMLHVFRSPFTQVLPQGIGAVDLTVRTTGPGAGGSVLLAASQLWRVRGDQLEPVPLPADLQGQRIEAVLEDARGTLWVALSATRAGSIILARPRMGPERRFEEPKGVQALVEDPARGRVLWLSETQYCEVSATSTAGAGPRCVDLGPWGSRSLLVGRDGTIWIAGRRGVQANRTTGIRLFTPEQGHPLGQARALYEDSDGALWVGTYNGGLGRIRGDSVAMVHAHDGLAEDVISTILEDDEAHLWMGGNRGIQHLPRRLLNDFLDGRTRRVAAVLHGAREGLINPEGTGLSGVRGGDGRLWFPTFGGAVAFQPAERSAITVRPGSIAITRLAIGGDSLAIADTVTLPAGRRQLEVTVAAVSLRAPGAEVLEYRLAGHQDDWTALQERRVIRLSGLRPGRWTLEVRASAPTDTDPATVQRLVLDVPAAWHEARWFLPLGMATLALLLLGGIHVRTRLLSRRAQSLTAEVDEQTHWLTVEHDRTAAALERAAEASARLRNLLTAKSKAFASLSHELRTPMSLVLAPLEELEHLPAGELPPAAREHVGTLRRAVQRLERLTAQFLDLADTQSGTVRIDRRPVDVGSFLRGCVMGIAPVAARKEVELLLQIPDGPPLVARLDQDHMDKVVANLISNAIRYSPAKGTVRIRLLEDGAAEARALLLEVADDGPGIPAELLERIFDPFFQGPNATEGMGLGLALSRDVVVLHGGQIEAFSPPGQGATFRVTLPLGLEDAVAGGVAGVILEDAATEEAAGVAVRRRVLVVEDDTELREFLARRLGAQHEVRAVSNGDEALAMLRAWQPDLIVSDIVMPGLDGLALCRILKADPSLRHIPFILLTAKGGQEDRERGLLLGADDYVVKPFEMRQLTLRIANLLRLRQDIADRFQEALPAWASILMRSASRTLDKPSEQFVERLYRVLIDGIADPALDVDSMAKALFMSRATLYRRVRELLSCSPLDLLSEVRLEQAALLLRTEQDTVGSIAARVGFRSAAHFSRRFVAHFGMSPAVYRARVKGGVR